MPGHFGLFHSFFGLFLEDFFTTRTVARHPVGPHRQNAKSPNGGLSFYGRASEVPAHFRLSRPLFGLFWRAGLPSARPAGTRPWAAAGFPTALLTLVAPVGALPRPASQRCSAERKTTGSG